MTVKPFQSQLLIFFAGIYYAGWWFAYSKLKPSMKTPESLWIVGAIEPKTMGNQCFQPYGRIRKIIESDLQIRSTNLY